MKKFSIVFVLVALLTAALAACAPAATQAPAATEAAPAATEAAAPTTAEPIKIGYIGDLSGSTAVWGQAGLNGAILTAEEINKNGGILGRPVEIVSADGRGQAADSVNAFNKLVDQDKVLAVIGTNFSSCNAAIAPIADEKHVPVLATAASNPKVTVDPATGKLHPYSFRIGFIDPFQGEVLANFAFNELKFTKAAVITNVADDYSVGLSKYFTDQFVKDGGTIVASVEAQSGDNDFRAQLDKIAAANPEVLMIPWTYKDVALIANQAREAGITAVFIGGDGWDSAELLTMAGPALEGGFYTSQASYANEITKPFAEAYTAKFNLAPETEALFTHDGLYWIKQALETAGKVDSVSLRDALEGTTSFTGLMGEMSIDPATHNPSKPSVINQIKDGKFVYYGSFK
jgi:branched-chain amino acid transport system substrate-binding protein